jgi:hypothetical protein
VKKMKDQPKNADEKPGSGDLKRDGC